MTTLAAMAGATAQRPGDAGIAAARAGGTVVVCRHGATDSVDENEQTLRYDDLSTQRRLSVEGERRSRQMAEALRTLGVSAGEVIASPMQRARLTAEMLFGSARLDSAWHTRGDRYDGPKRDARLAILHKPVERGNRFIFSHIGTIYSVVPSIQGQLEEGDCAVLRPRGTSFDVVEVVPWYAWLRAAGRT